MVALTNEIWNDKIIKKDNRVVVYKDYILWKEKDVWHKKYQEKYPWSY